MSIRFKHFPAQALEQYGTKIKCNGLTLCYSYDNVKSELSFSIAHCHKKDTYTRKIGRDIALDKFLNKEVGHKITIHMSKKAFMEKKHEFFNSLAYNILTQTY